MNGVSAWRDSRPYILRHFVAPGAAGVLAGQICVAVLLRFDVGGLASLIRQTHALWPAVPMLCVGCAVTFGSAAIGGSVMAIGRE